jgi:hypothetical protein
VLLRLVVQYRTNAIPRLVGGNSDRIDPGAVDIGIEIIAGPECGVHVIEQQSRVQLLSVRGNDGCGAAVAVVVSTGRNQEGDGGVRGDNPVHSSTSVLRAGTLPAVC